MNSFDSMINLKDLDLSYNKIKSIQNGLLRNLNNLEMLWLQVNEIDKIEINSFDSLIKLKELVLVWNKIKSIQNDLFRNLTNLEILFLNENEIDKNKINSKWFIKKFN